MAEKHGGGGGVCEGCYPSRGGGVDAISYRLRRTMEECEIRHHLIPKEK